MNPDSRFPKLPSLSDLLGHPTVAQVVKRVNQTTIAQRATGFLEELQANLRHRLEQGQVPSLGQLAERFARRLLGPALTPLPAVNATGTLLGDRWPALPLAEPAVDEMVRIASEYHAGDDALVERVNHALIELSSSEAVLVVGSFRAACEIGRSLSRNIEVAQYAGFLNSQDYGLGAFPTISDRLSSGAELIVVDSAGLIGGPSCGIFFAKREMAEALSKYSQRSTFMPTTITLAALAATLSIYQSGERVIYQIPIWQLLTAPLENLEQRSQRLSMLIGANERIASATPTRCDSTWCDSPEMKLAAPSWAIVVRPQPNEFDACINSLGEANPRILARIYPEEIWLDLRGVFPRWDQHLVSCFQ